MEWLEEANEEILIDSFFIKTRISWPLYWVDVIDIQNDVKDIVITAADQGPMEASEVHESDIQWSEVRSSDNQRCGFGKFPPG